MIIHVHYKNHKAYQIVSSEVMIQENDVWVPAILYKPMEDLQKSFVRSKTEFNEKFMEVTVPVLPTQRR